MKLSTSGLALLKKTPRKSSVENGHRQIFCDKLRSNSSFKKERPRAEEYSPSPTAFRDSSTSKSRPHKSIGRRAEAAFKGLDFVPLVRKNTKNSDTLAVAKRSIDYDTEDFFSYIGKSPKYAIEKFDSKGTLSVCKSTTVGNSLPKNESWIVNKLRPETRQFLNEVDKILIRQSSSKSQFSESKAVDWDSTKRIIAIELDDLFLPFGDLEVTRPIGKGATSEVFVGNFNFCPVAIKKIKLSNLSPKQIVNIVNEASCLKKIKHPNVIALYGLSIDSSQNLYLVTELCEQLSMKSFFKKFKQKIPPAVKIKLVMDIAKSLFHIHGERLGIIHRDIKPENIFLTTELKAKLGDFGIAKMHEGAEQVADKDKLDTIATLHYMAPECMLRGQYTVASDIYSFGVVCWELLHEKEPFEGLNEFNLISSVVNSKCPLEFDRSIVPEEIGSLLKSCLSINPEDRPSAKTLCTKVDEHIKKNKK